MSWGRALLIVGVVVGSLVVMLGVLALLATVTDPTDTGQDRTDGVIGSVVIMSFGAAVLAPCLVFLVLSGRRTRLPVWQPGLVYGLTPPGAAPSTYTPVAQPPDLRGSYLEWFGWCQREVGGDAVALNSATMAALGAAMARDSGGALQAARDAAQLASPAVPSGQTRKVRGGKVKVLSRIGAATLPLLEPGETVIASFYATDRKAQMWQMGFGLIGYLIAASQSGAYYVTVSDRRVIVLTGSQLTLVPRDLAFAVPRSVVTQATYHQGLFRDTFAISRVTGERTRLLVTRVWRREASLAARNLTPGIAVTPTPAPPLLR